jgi:two-component system nitrogen regulation response regulator GlnG
MQEVFKIVGQVTASDVTVMVTGESGTGKELVARSIWKHSHRANKPFIAVNCAAIPDNLIESELFGHEKGSFTGATVQRIGKFELCDGGTIFLDEIGDMALATQTKILRVLQQGEIQRVGGSETIRVDVRIIAATNKDLEAIVKTKAFREDLYYRLNVVRIKMPPLRDRIEDIPQIVDFCLQNLVKNKKARVAKVSPEALSVLTRHSWPGNVRELENVIERATILISGSTLTVADLDFGRRLGMTPSGGIPIGTSAEGGGAASGDGGRSLYRRLSEQERGEIISAVERAQGNIAHAARALGINRSTLYYRMRKHGLEHLLPTRDEVVPHPLDGEPTAHE